MSPTRKAVPIVLGAKVRKRRVPVAHPRDGAVVVPPERDTRAPAGWLPVTTRPARVAHEPGA